MKSGDSDCDQSSTRGVECIADCNNKSSRGVPWGAMLLGFCPPFLRFPKISYKVLILFLTYLCYINYHMTRKAFSTVKAVLAPNCSDDYSSNASLSWNESSLTDSGWAPFNGGHCKFLLGTIDYSWAFAYAIATFFSGPIADRVNLRYFLTFGMIGCGVGTGLLGVAYFARIHHFSYFIGIQLFNGAVQSTGSPGTMAVNANWFGKQGRGLVMGFWNSNTFMGNIIGTSIAAIWAQSGRDWGWSFIVPGLITIACAMVIFNFLVVDPTDVGLSAPKHHKEKMMKAVNPLYEEASLNSSRRGSYSLSQLEKHIEKTEKSESAIAITNDVKRKSSIQEGNKNPAADKDSVLSINCVDSMEPLKYTDVQEKWTPVLDPVHEEGFTRNSSFSSFTLSQMEKNIEPMDEVAITSTNDFKWKMRIQEWQGKTIDDSSKDSDSIDSVTDSLDSTDSLSCCDVKSSCAYSIFVGNEKGAIGILGALRIPGLVEFAFSFFFLKLVAYTFLFWLPFYVENTPIDGKQLSNEKANLLSTFFDVGGIIGGILAGIFSDLIKARGIACGLMLYLAVPVLFLYRTFGGVSIALSAALMTFSGFLIGGPYTLIHATVSNDLGTHKSLKNNQNAKATVSALLNGTGSIGAGLGPLLAGWILDSYNWDCIFYLLMASCFLSALLLSRVVIREIIKKYKDIKWWCLSTF